MNFVVSAIGALMLVALSSLSGQTHAQVDTGLDLQNATLITPVGTTVDTRSLLTQLRVAPENGTGYDRSLFPHWADTDHDGCDTRREVLLAESRTATATHGACVITGGTWTSPYDGRTYTGYGYRYLDVDHMVPLAEAWASGARSWTRAKRAAYANDLGYRYSLIAVSASANRSKSDSEPREWMPDKASYRCTYLASWVAIKWRWNLAVDRDERAWLTSALSGCGTKARIATPKRAS